MSSHKSHKHSRDREGDGDHKRSRHGPSYSRDGSRDDRDRYGPNRRRTPAKQPHCRPCSKATAAHGAHPAAAYMPSCREPRGPSWREADARQQEMSRDSKLGSAPGSNRTTPTKPPAPRPGGTVLGGRCVACSRACLHTYRMCGY